MKCEHMFILPEEMKTKGKHCGAYSAAKRTDGLYWAHFPKCESKNCPVLHPNLLKDAILKAKKDCNTV